MKEIVFEVTWQVEEALRLLVNTGLFGPDIHMCAEQLLRERLREVELKFEKLPPRKTPVRETVRATTERTKAEWALEKIVEVFQYTPPEGRLGKIASIIALSGVKLSPPRCDSPRASAPEDPVRCELPRGHHGGHASASAAWVDDPPSDVCLEKGLDFNSEDEIHCLRRPGHEMPHTDGRTSWQPGVVGIALPEEKAALAHEAGRADADKAGL